jgi:ATP-binding cassette subfamily B protein
MTVLRPPKRRLLVPEVVQTSAMDCGPAVLKCVLEGFGIPVHYGRLREACQTDIDGTSIDVLESVAGQLGLLAEQVMLPVNHLLLPEAEALPAIVVVTLPGGLTHFVLVWRRHGPLVQVMDPAVGRRWVSCRRFLEEVYVHSHRLPAATWHEWALSEDFQRPLARRLRDLGLNRDGEAMIAAAAEASGWGQLARLDAAVRLAESLVRVHGLRRGRAARGFLDALLGQPEGEAPGKAPPLPEAYWSVFPDRPAPNGAEQVRMRGAVLVRVRGRAPPVPAPGGPGPETLSPELAAARAEPAGQPLHTLGRLLRGQGRMAGLLLAAGLAAVAGGSVLEGVLLRDVIDLGWDLGLVEQRLLAVGVFLAFAGGMLLLEFRVAAGLVRLGRHLEARFRVAFFEKIPRLPDRYFRSRPTSDMAERSHAIQQLRLLPRLGGQLVRAALTLLLTAGAIAWVDPGSAAPALLAAAVAIGLPLAFNPLLGEMDLRVRTHAGALSRFYLDALLGLAAVRAHGAERAVRREHEGLVVEWARASRRLLRWVVAVEGLQVATGFGLAGWLLFLHAGRLSDAGGALLLAYWALSLPVLGEEVALLARQYPIQRNVILRLLEPLGALESEVEPAGEENPLSGQHPPGQPPDREGEAAAGSSVGPAGPAGPGPVRQPGPPAGSAGASPSRDPEFRPGEAPAQQPPPGHPVTGVSVTFKGVTVRAAGHTILEDVRVQVAAGEQVAIVGASGAGKSSLVGLLLGWHRAAAGRVLIDGAPLDADRLDRLRAETAWVDPAVQLWNRSLAQNLVYGTHPAGPPAFGDVLPGADLLGVLQRLPDGLQTSLGEGGGLLSAGEGQRVRLGRALLRSPARLVILDEPFRGLDREKRRELLGRVRQVWHGATLLCITHDVGETRAFERVLVVEGGRVVEDGPPERLAEDPATRYRAFLDAESAVRRQLWASAVWRRLWLTAGRLAPGNAEGQT